MNYRYILSSLNKHIKQQQKKSFLQQKPNKDGQQRSNTKFEYTTRNGFVVGADATYLQFNFNLKFRILQILDAQNMTYDISLNSQKNADLVHALIILKCYN